MEKKENKQIEELEKKLAEAEKLKNEYLEGWKRERADFLNFKKDEYERISQSAKYIKESVVLKILPVIDTFLIAEKKISEELKGNECIKGLLQIKLQLQEFLKSQGVEEIKTENEKFDHNLHEAVECLEKKDKESGSIIEEVQRGYIINGRLLRPAKVKVVK